MSAKPKFTVSKNGSKWSVFKMEYNGDAASGTKVFSNINRIIAITEMYKLNGWNPKNIK